MKHLNIKLFSAVALGLFVSACGVKRADYDLPSLELPDKYKNAGVDATAGGNPAETAPSVVPQSVSRWWEHYGNEELNKLVTEGLANNYQLKAAIQRIIQAHALAGVENADEWPELSGTGGYEIETPAGGLGTLESGTRRRSRHTYQVGLEASYEIDLWGKNRAKTEAAYQRAWASLFDREVVALTLTSDITNNFIEYLSLLDRIRIAEETKQTLLNMETAVRQRVEGGEATSLELAQQSTAVAASKSVIPILELQRDQRINAIALLVGKSPSHIDIKSNGLADIKVPDTSAPGVPSRLLLRRPDIRSIEANMVAANADIDVARAALFPSLDLSAEAGFGAHHLDLLISPQAFFANAAVSVTQSIFDAGRRKNQIKFEEAQHAELVNNYSQAIYTAVKEVEDSLVSIRYLSLQFDRQAEAVAAAKLAYDYAKESYDIGATDFLTLLDTERTLEQERDQLHRVDFGRIRASVDLFKALGGSMAPKEIRAAAATGSEAKSVSRVAIKDEPALDPLNDIAPTLPLTGYWTHLASVWSEQAAWRHWRRLQNQFPEQLTNVKPLIQRQHIDKEKGVWVTILVGPFEQADAALGICKAFKDKGSGCQIMAR